MKYLSFFILLFYSIFVFSQSLIAKDNTFLRKGNQAFEENNPLEAEKSYRKSLEINPNNTTAQYNLGNALYAQKRYEEAANEFQALTQHPDNQNISYNLGNSLLEQKKYAEAIAAYKQTLRKNPKDADARYNLAYAQSKLKEQEQEKKDKKQEQDSEDKEKDDQKKQEEQKKKEEQQKQEEQKKQEEKQKDAENQQKKEDKKQEGDKPQENEGQQKPMGISQEDAKRMMEALKNEEEKVRARVQQQRNQQQMGSRKGNKGNIEGSKDW